jgi:hypothetical protein
MIALPIVPTGTIRFTFRDHVWCLALPFQRSGAPPHDLRQAAGIVAVGFGHRFHRGMGLARLDADRRQAHLAQAIVKPGRSQHGSKPMRPSGRSSWFNARARATDSLATRARRVADPSASAPAATAQPAATPHPSNPFRIEVQRDYAAGERLESSSLAPRRPEEPLRTTSAPAARNPAGRALRGRAMMSRWTKRRAVGGSRHAIMRNARNTVHAPRIRQRATLAMPEPR